MAIGATARWELRTTGATTNGSGYDPSISGAGTDYSQQDAPQLSVADAVFNGTTTVTSVTGGFTSSMIGNAFYDSITGATGRTFITAVGSSNSITVSSTMPANTGVTMR